MRKGRKVAKHCVFPMIWGSGGSKSRLAKAAGAEPAGQMRDEKLPAVVARSTFPSQNAQNTRGSDHFWKLRCRKSAHRCGAKHISKSKCTKHQGFGSLLEVAMSKKCTPLWREVHFQVKMYKTPGVRTIFGSCDVEKVHAFVARSTFPSQNVQNTPGPDHFWQLRCRKSARRCGALSHTSHTTLSHTTFHTPSFTHHLSHTIFDTPSFTHHFVTHHLSHTIFDTPSFTHHLSFSHTIFDTPSFTHHFVTHHLSHTTLSHTIFVTHHLSDTIFHTQLSHTPSFAHRHRPSCTHHFVTHHLSHIILSHTIFQHTIFPTQLCHTPSFATPSFTHNFVTHHLSHT